jgi:hypothetical protein
MSATSLHRAANFAARAALVWLLMLTTYSLVAGAIIAMYWDVVPSMDALEDALGRMHGTGALLVLIMCIPNLLIGAAQTAQGQRSQGLTRIALSAGVLFILIAAEGLIAHALWWSPISDTGQFHMLHHTLTTALPLSLAYALLYWRFAAPRLADAGAMSMILATTRAKLAAIGMGVLVLLVLATIAVMAMGLGI